MAEVGTKITTKNKLFWAFNGEMEEGEIRRQIADFKEKGFGGFFMHARSGLTIPYMGERWMKAIAVAIDEAKKRGMEAWLYDEDGWPSGFGGGAVNGKGEEYCQKSLFCAAYGEGENKNVLAGYKKGAPKASPKTLKRYECFKKAGYHVCDENEKAELVYRYKVNRFYADIFNEKAVAEFINCTHEKYKEYFEGEFGKTVKGIFTDEPQYFFHPYSPYLFGYFKERNGYEAKDWLFLLEEDSEAGRVFREDYYDAVCFLYEKNYVKNISDWCRKNGLLFTGHFPEEDGVSTQYLKGGDIMLNYVNMDYPGIDFLGRRLTSPVLLKQISSVKNQLGKAHVISESFGCCGWNASLADYKRIWGYESAFGIDTACMHLAAYTIRGVRKRDYPAFFSYQSSWWEHVGVLNGFMDRVNEFAQKGEPVNDVLVISPVSGAYGEVVHSDEARLISTQFRILVEALIDLQIQFDVADENYLSEVPVEVGEGGVRVGKMRYSVIIVPYSQHIKASTARIVEEAGKKGTRVAFTSKKPQYCDGRAWTEGREIFGKYEYGAVVQNRRPLWKKYFDFIKYENKVNVISADGDRSDGLVVRVREDKDCVYFAIFNQSAENYRRSTLQLKGPGTIYEICLQNGAEENVTGYCDRMRTYASLDISPGETRLYVMKKGSVLKGIKWKTERVEALEKCSCALCDENSFNVDKAALSVDGENFGEEKYILEIQDDIHRLSLTSDRERRVVVKYRFFIGKKPRKINLCCEFLTADSIELNGRPLSFGTDRYIDRSIGKTDVSSLVKEGENEVLARYTVRPKKQAFDLKEVFETEKNRFFYNTETESIYLTGDFDVKATGRIQESPGFYRVEDEGFILTLPEKKDFDEELTRQGLWFYRGAVAREFIYRHTGGRIFLSLKGSSGVATQLLVNGREAGYLSGGERCEITELLAVGENRIEAKLLGSNRNLLGPHHHYAGEQKFVGVNTFRGTRGYEDEVVTVGAPENTFVSSYAFVKFEAGNLFITKKISGGRNEEQKM